VVREVSGFARSRVEGALARGRAKVGPTSGIGMDVVGGNFFYTAQPLGVRGGVDFGYTGEVRSVDTAKINRHLENGEIVMLTSLGYSASGDVFNVKTEEVAARVSAALGAAKLIYFTPGMFLKREERCTAGTCQPERAFSASVLQSMRLTEAKHVLHYYEAKSFSIRSTASAPDPVDLDSGSVHQVSAVPAVPAALQTNPEVEEIENAAQSETWEYMLQLCCHCVHALEGGVTRAHFLPPTPGALIQELYTADGMGTLIAKDLYDGIRLATPADVPCIVDLISPLEQKGVLITRDRGKLARDVHQGFYYVFTRDTAILGCANLKRYTPEIAELGCLVVSPAYRKQGLGDAMLCYLERTAIAAGVTSFFALSTHTMQWFIERGFSESSATFLPKPRRAMIDPKRGSKIYCKQLGSGRSIDAQELFWDPPNADASRNL